MGEENLREGIDNVDVGDGTIFSCGWGNSEVG